MENEPHISYIALSSVYLDTLRERVKRVRDGDAIEKSCGVCLIEPKGSSPLNK